MIILSDCLTEKEDEGCLKVANSLTKRIKKLYNDTTIISFDRRPIESDVHLNLNKLFLNKTLISLIRKKNEDVLYIPFASNTLASAVRTLLLAVYSHKRVKVLFALRHPMSKLNVFLLSISKAEIIVLSHESWVFFSSKLKNKINYITTGVDTKKFHPVSTDEKILLRKKYNINSNDKVVVHVGHLHKGRNIDKLLNISDEYHLYVVVSSVTEKIKDDSIRQRFLQRKNTTLVEEYIKSIQEIYQIADVYVFPVLSDACIDVPLSVLEAASCDIPIVCTRYGELKEFQGKLGFTFLDDVEKETLNEGLKQAMSLQNKGTRDAVLSYDWDFSIKKIVGYEG